MGKLFTLLLVAISFSGFGQVYQTFNAYGWEVNRIKLNNGLTLPTYAGLPSIGTVSNSSVDLRGTLIYNTDNSTVYAWDGSQWVAVGSGGGGTYTAAFGMALTGSAFRVDSTVITSQARTSAGLATKQPLEDQRLSTTNSPIFNRIITSNTTNTDAVQMSFINTTYNAMTFFQDGNSFAQLAAIGDNAGLGARNGNFEFNLNRKKSIAFQVKSIEQFRIDSGNVALPQGALTMGSSIIVFGNSIPNGVGASVSDSSYVKVIDSLKKYSSTNNASNGSCIGDQAGVIFSEVTAPTKQYIYDLSVNDYRLHTSANHYTFYKYGLMDEVAWLGLRDSSKIKANSTSVTYTGTWTTPGVYGGLTRGSSTVASTASMRLKGSTILVSTINQNANTGGFTISVDGSVKYTWARPATNIVSVNGATFAPYLIPITGLYDSMHTVVITVTSITGGDAVYFNWAAGTSGLQSGQFEPSVYVNDASRQTSAGYATNGGSDALCAAYNAIIYDAVDFLASIGVNCVQVRGGSALNPLTDLSDGIHPNDRGHRIEAYSYINKMNGIIYPKDRQRAGGSYTNGAINYNSNSLGFGTSGQVLTSGGSGVIPTWTTPSGGGSTDTTSLSSRINYKPRVYNVKAYGAVGDSVNDDRAAIQAAILDAADNGGGDVYFPNGKYWLGTGKYTSLASGANPDAQLYLPLGDYARSDTNLSIRFIGESAPNFYANPFDAGHLPITSGVVLASGLTGTGSIIGTDYKFQAWGNFNFNHLILENLTLRANTVGDSTVATAVDGRYMSYLSVKSVRADNKRDQGSTIKPATNSYAIRMPSINNFVFCNVDNFLAYNYGVGIEAGEHSNMDNVFIDGCYIGVKATEANHSMNINRMCIARTAINFVLDTSLSTNRIGEITAQQVSVENTTTGGYWFTHVADLIDNSSGKNWVGNIHYNRVLSFGGPNNTTYTIPKTTKVNLIKPSNQYVSTANAVTGITIENTNSGTSAQSNFQAIAGTTGVNFGVSGTGFTPNNIIAADQAYINSSKNLNILMSAGNMKVATVNTNQYETVEFNNPSQYPSLVLNATRAAGTSQNAIQFRKIGVSKFMIGNDLSANNTNDFYIYDYGGAATRLYISSGGSVGIGNTSPTSTLNVTGSVGLSYVAKTSAYTATAADHTIDCTTGTFTVTLPTAVSVTGRMYVVKNSGAGAITVGTTSSQTIDGSTTYSLGTQYKYVHLQSNGANWIVIANN